MMTGLLQLLLLATSQPPQQQQQQQQQQRRGGGSNRTQVAAGWGGGGAAAAAAAPPPSARRLVDAGVDADAVPLAAGTVGEVAPASPQPLPGGGRGGLAPRRRPETRWYTSAGSRAQLSDETGHLTGVFSCCSGFAIYPNASFSCPDAAGFAKRNFGGPNATFTVDHVISICHGCDVPGSGVPFDWHAAKAGIPAMVECANTGNITGFVIDWEPPARACPALPAMNPC